ncbi:MAG: hypothetical protein ACREEM_45140, partial [Blastocatellia bacterium]
TWASIRGAIREAQVAHAPRTAPAVIAQLHRSKFLGVIVFHFPLVIFYLSLSAAAATPAMSNEK